MQDDEPHLPFEGGLPQTEPMKGKRRKKTVAPSSTTTWQPPSRWRRVRRAVRDYVKDVSYGVAVKVGVAVVVLVGGLVVGDQRFDLFGRKKATPKIEIPKEWPFTIERP